MLHLSGGIAEGYLAKLLSDGGAEVLLVEPPSGHPLRGWSASGAAVDPDRGGALFQYLSAGSASLSCSALEDVDRLEELASVADVLIEGQAILAGAPEVAKRLREAGAAKVSVRITPFGSDGPWAGRPATEFTLQAWTGSLGKRGDPAREPLAVGGRTGDWSAGVVAAASVLAALRRREATGRAEDVDVSELEVLAMMHSAYAVTFSSITGKPQRRSRLLKAPSVLPTSDGLVGLGALTAQHWISLCEIAGLDDLLADPSLTAQEARALRYQEIQAELAAWTKRHTTAEVVELAGSALPSTPVGNGETLPSTDHFVERGSFVENPGGFVQPGPAYSFSAMELAPVRPAPTLGGGGEATASRWLEASRSSEGDDLRGSMPVGSSTGSGTDGRLPFEGMRVLDVTAWWAGPIVGQFLTSLGAEVIHVESVKRIDGVRYHAARPSDEESWWEWGPLYHPTNMGKQNITLDLRDPDGLALAKELIASCDVLLENSSPRVFTKLGLGWEQVREINPRIVMVRMPAFGLTGPWRERPGFAATIEQASGLAWLTGYEDTEPVVPDSLADPLGGLHSVIGTLLAIAWRDRTGEGQLVEAPLVGGSLAIAAEQIVEASAYGRLLMREGNHSPYAAPQNAYLCADVDDDGVRDAWVAVSVETDEHWRCLVAALGRPGWAADPSLDTLPGRRAAQDEMDEHLARWCAQRRRDEVLDQLWSSGVPVAPVLMPYEQREVAQLEARGFFEEIEHPVVGTHPYQGWPARLSEGPSRWNPGPAPTLGQHNREILRSLGRDEAEIDRLEAANVIGTVPLGSAAPA